MISFVEKRKTLIAKLREKLNNKGSFKKSGKEPLSKSHFLEIELAHKISDVDNNITEFWFKPNKGIIIYRIVVEVGLFNDEIATQTNIIYNSNEWYLLVGYENVEKNLIWNFQLFGKENGSDKHFNLSVNYKT